MAEFIIKRDDEYLEHFGIKGQKWGVRRFQNEDGTRTPAGKKREAAARETDSMSDDELRQKISRLNDERNYERIMSDRNKSKTPQRLRTASNVIKIGSSMMEIGNSISRGTRPDPGNNQAAKEAQKAADERYKNVKTSIDSTRRIADDTAKLGDQVSKTKSDPKVRADLKKMSDAELKRNINRMLLEEQYDRLMAPQRVSKGEKFTNNVLPMIATSVSILGTAATLALTISQLAGKK